MRKIRIISFVLMVVMLFSAFSFSTAFAATGEPKTFNSQKEACVEIRKGILERRNEVGSSSFDYYFTVYYKTKTYNSKTVYSEVRQEVYKHTGKYNEGDALKASIVEDGLNISAQNKGSYYLVRVVVYGKYYLSKTNYDKMNKWVKNNSMYLATKKYKTGTSDYGKALGIYKWITKNVKYGKKSLGNEWEPWTQAYGAIYGKGTCAGIAQLTYMMMNAAGVQCRMQRCYDHAWVIVKLNSKWYIVDPTFGLGKSGTPYFLLGTKNYSRSSKVWADEYGGNITVNKTKYSK